MSKNKRAHGLTAVRVEGGLLPPDFLRAIAAQEATYQTDADYRVTRSLRLKDELGRYWRIARDLWATYQQRRQQEGVDQTRVALDFLESFFRDVLGFYDLRPVNGVTAEGRQFGITHEAVDGEVPFLLVSHRYDLDRSEARFGEEGRRRSPSNLMQEYLNASDRLQWGLVSNGNRIRLFRDNPSLTRPAYIECDLELMLTDEIYSDFTAMFLLLHDSRFRRTNRRAGRPIIEQWRREAQETGERALAKLRDGVANAMQVLGSGFLAHPQNEALREKIAGGRLTPQEYYQQLLRLVYRFLFLFTVEDRDLLFPPKMDPEKRRIYEEGYSLSMLRERALRRGQEERYSDLWQGLQIVFRGLAGDAEVRDVLGVPALGGLFAKGQCPDLEEAQVGNSYLLKAVRALAYFQTDSGLARVNYRDMDSEELGSVYEGLLELHPQFNVDERPWSFTFINFETGGRGSERKSTGSYYTPSSLVNELIKSALEPVLAKAIEENPTNPRQAILELSVVDPACGSGHFLLAAARRMAAELARLEADGNVPDEHVRRRALREVVQHCIYGVDKNPLAVELCRVALWMETVEPGKPLSFLDAHIQCGDSLIGLLEPSVLADGIPMDAYTALTGDEKAAERELKRLNKTNAYTLQYTFFDPAPVEMAAEVGADLSAMPEDTLEDLAAKRLQYEALRRHPRWVQARDAADLYVAAFFLPKRMDCIDEVPINTDLARLIHNERPRPGVLEAARRVAEEQRFLHWHLAFPEVMKRGGFDVVVGNPPWERVKLQEQEFFAARSPVIAKAKNKAERERLIKRLEMKEATPAERAIFAEYQRAKRASEASSLFLRKSGRFPLTAFGDVNTYAVFSELFLRLVSSKGRAGLIVPTGIATDDSTKRFFEEVSTKGRLVSLLSLENEEFIFPTVHHSYRFCLLTLAGGDVYVERPEFVFFARQPTQLQDTDRRFSLTPSEICLINPNTRTCPVFRSKADAELTKKIYSRVPALVHDGHPKEGNPWGISFMTMFHMSNDSRLFRTYGQLSSDGARLHGQVWIDRQGRRWLPLYEAKMTHQYDHRWATYSASGEETQDVPDEYKALSNFEPTPRYWVLESEVEERLASRGWNKGWLAGWRDITSAHVLRTVIASVLPRVGVGNSLPLFFVDDRWSQSHVAALLGNLSALVLDFLARHKVGGTHLNFFIVKQLAVLPPQAYSSADLDIIVPRVLELVYTSESIRGFAQDLGYEGPAYSWDPKRRSQLRAELDAYYAHLYGLTRDELLYVLDPTNLFGPDYPSETFRVLKEVEIRQYGEYRTQRLVLEAWDRLVDSR